MYIIFEGPDGAGKSTIINSLCDKLKDKKILKVQQPGTTKIGLLLRNILKGSCSMTPMTRQALHMADTAEFNEALTQIRKDWDLVIQDRTSFISSPIYGKSERGSCNYHIDWYKHIATQKADKLFIILSKRAEEQSRQRGEGDHFDNQDTSFHAKVYQEYLNFATDDQYRKYTDLIVERRNLHVVHNDGDVEDTVKRIIELLELDF